MGFSRSLGGERWDETVIGLAIFIKWAHYELMSWNPQCALLGGKSGESGGYENIVPEYSASTYNFPHSNTSSLITTWTTSPEYDINCESLNVWKCNYDELGGFCITQTQRATYLYIEVTQELKVDNNRKGI